MQALSPCLPLRAYWEGMHLEGRDLLLLRGGRLLIPAPSLSTQKKVRREGRQEAQPPGYGVGIRGGEKKLEGTSF